MIYYDFNDFIGFCDKTLILTPDVVMIAITHCISMGNKNIVQSGCIRLA